MLCLSPAAREFLAFAPLNLLENHIPSHDNLEGDMAGEKQTEETTDSKPLMNKIIDTVVDAAASYVKGVAADGAETLEKKARSTRLGKAAVALADQAEKPAAPRGVSKKASTLAKSK